MQTILFRVQKSKPKTERRLLGKIQAETVKRWRKEIDEESEHLMRGSESTLVFHWHSGIKQAFVNYLSGRLSKSWLPSSTVIYGLALGTAENSFQKYPLPVQMKYNS